MTYPSEKEVYDALKSRHGEELQIKISKTTVAVCGLGGLGSNIAISLARLGVGKLILIDFDTVNLKNINRQQYAMKHIGMYKTEAIKEIIGEIMPYVAIEAYKVKLNEENIADIISGAEIICEAFDSASAKAMLVNTVLEKYPLKYVISASGMAGIEDANSIKTRKITKHFYLCGDGESDITKYKTLYATRVMLCAAHQAHTALRIIANLD